MLFLCIRDFLPFILVANSGALVEKLGRFTGGAGILGYGRGFFSILLFGSLALTYFFDLLNRSIRHFVSVTFLLVRIDLRI